MLDVNQQIRTALLRRLVMQTRYENDVIKDLRRAWRAVLNPMLAAVRGAGLGVKEPGPFAWLRGGPVRVDQTQRVSELLQTLAEIWRQARRVVVQRLQMSLLTFAELEMVEVPQTLQLVLSRSRRQAALAEAGEEEIEPAISAAFSQVPVAQISQLLTSPLGGAFFMQAFGDLEARVLMQLRSALTMGLLQGQGVPTVTRAVQSVLNNSRWQAERIVRSEFGRVGAQAAQLQFVQNQELLRGVQWVATLDARTCIQCGNLDGRVWNDPTQAPLPVVSTHPNCRCVVIPLIKGIPGLTLPPSSRASAGGQIPGTVTYKDWFGQQDTAFQRETLGPTRYRLWSSGKLKLGDFSTASGVRSVASALALARSRA